MNITLYTTTSPRIQISKVLSGAVAISGEPHEIVSETEMSLRLSIDRLASVKASNYCYIGDTGKYYYISPNYEIDNHTVIINLKEDVLMSFKSQIYAQTCTISRNERQANSYLFDNGYQLLAYKNIVTKKFPSGLTDNSIILMTTG